MALEAWALPTLEATETPTPPARVRRRRAGFDEGRWRSRAACSGTDTALFFPVGELSHEAVRQIHGAKIVCERCPVRLHCLVYALSSNQEEGVWGGLVPSERRALRRVRLRREHRAQDE